MRQNKEAIYGLLFIIEMSQVYLGSLVDLLDRLMHFW